jgi:hypothetical protein
VIRLPRAVWVLLIGLGACALGTLVTATGCWLLLQPEHGHHWLGVLIDATQLIWGIAAVGGGLYALVSGLIWLIVGWDA